MTAGLHKGKTLFARQSYMSSLNGAQPPISTILSHRSTYHAG